MGRKVSGGMNTFKQQVRYCTKRTASLYPFHLQLTTYPLPCFCFVRVISCNDLCRKFPSEQSPLSARRALRSRGAGNLTSLMHTTPLSSVACTLTTKTRSTRNENFEHRLSERMVPDMQPQRKPSMTWRASLYQTRGADLLEMTKVMPVKEG